MNTKNRHNVVTLIVVTDENDNENNQSGFGALSRISPTLL